jgi:hypothetical protein
VRFFNFNQGPGANFGFDNLSVVPEPSSLALLAGPALLEPGSSSAAGERLKILSFWCVGKPVVSAGFLFVGIALRRAGEILRQRFVH